VINPFNGTIISNVPEGTREDAKKAIDCARDAFDRGEWSNMTPGERSLLLLRIAEVVEKNLDQIAHVETINQGRPITDTKTSDLPFGIDNIRFFAGASRALEGISSNEFLKSGTSIIRREPIGVVSCIIPWNYPWMIGIWKIIPAIAMGNTVVVKPATYTPLSLLEFVKLIDGIGIPKGVINVITGPGNSIGEELVRNKKVGMVTMTGSTDTGKKIMSMSTDTLKKVSLELGGKAPFIVFEDADLDEATSKGIEGGFVNSGQDCTAATRFYIHENIFEKFVNMLVEKAKKIQVGDPLNPQTEMGPLISDSHRKKVESYVELGHNEGAKLIIGGKRCLNKECEEGFFYEPTIFTDVNQDMRIVQEEIFGPVLTVMKFKDKYEVIAKANDVAYGLAASVWATRCGWPCPNTAQSAIAGSRRSASSIAGGCTL
jgi:betaine-aldehyde dehydrogenase